MNKFWIVKLGALGDLVRTSFFFKNLSKLGQINVVGESWRVVGANPYINKIYNSVEDMMKEYDCGKVFSMEDCPEIINLLSNKFHNSLISGFYKKDQNILYTPESAAWNDMGINSRFGLDTANILKKNNYYTFDECHRVWLGCMEYPEIFDSSGSLMQSNKPIKKFLRVGFCPISNGRWKNKSLTFLVVSELISYFKSNGYGISLIGEVEGTFLEDSSFEQYRVETPSIDSLKYAILDCDIIVTCDSLTLHMAKGMGKPTVAFFGPTSAAEVSAGNNGVNIRALEEYYCNYSSTSIFSSLSTSRIIEGFNRAIELSNEE